jgi:hypothetical protein
VYQLLKTMKNLLFVLFLSIAAAGCSKSNDSTNSIGVITAAQVPAAVMNAYTGRYPSASGQIEWEREDGNTYKVKFFQGAQRWQAIFAADGGFVSEKQI